MPTNRRRYSRNRVRSHYERNKWRDLAAQWLDPNFIISGFDGDMEALEAYWREHGEEITEKQAWMLPGTRPPAWWEFDAPGDFPGDGDQAAFLEAHGLLFDHEREPIVKGIDYRCPRRDDA